MLDLNEAPKKKKKKKKAALLVTKEDVEPEVPKTKPKSSRHTQEGEIYSKKILNLFIKWKFCPRSHWSIISICRTSQEEIEKEKINDRED